MPGDCIGFVMGRNGQTLRSMEEEWGVLMFFAKTTDEQKAAGRDGDESLCIFGPLAARRGAEVKVMSAVEHKHPGYCVSSKGELRDVERVAGGSRRPKIAPRRPPRVFVRFATSSGTSATSSSSLRDLDGALVLAR